MGEQGLSKPASCPALLTGAPLPHLESSSGTPLEQASAWVPGVSAMGGAEPPTLNRPFACLIQPRKMGLSPHLQNENSAHLPGATAKVKLVNASDTLRTTGSTW